MHSGNMIEDNWTRIQRMMAASEYGNVPGEDPYRTVRPNKCFEASVKLGTNTLPRFLSCVVSIGVKALAHKAAGPRPSPRAKKTSSQLFFGRFQSMRGTDRAFNSPRVSSLTALVG